MRRRRLEKLRKILKIVSRALSALVMAGLLFFFLYCNSLWRVDEKTQGYYRELSVELRKQGHSASTLVLCGYRDGWFNSVVGGVRGSQHLTGKAIDILVFDVNGDGTSDEQDVDIVYEILDKRIDKDGGVGTYKGLKGFLNRQQVHFDSRGHWARWHW